MKNLIVVLLLVITSFSCSPKKRFDRLIAKNPYLIQTRDSVIKDTVYRFELISDTVKTTEFLTSIDTIYQIINRIPDKSFSSFGEKQKAKDKLTKILNLQKDCLYLTDSLIYDDKLLNIKLSVENRKVKLTINKKPQLVKTVLIPEKTKDLWVRDFIFWFLFFAIGFLTCHFINLFYDKHKSV
ncbi:MAG: hypothetical protein EBU90_01625 [Proteobacteria bacterium]|nr:hypothetical protein [Pseudomonadota bacterium]